MPRMLADAGDVVFTGIVLALAALMSTPALSDDGIERRRDQYGDTFGYFAYPIAGDIPGLGSAAGIGGTVVNMFDSDVDFTGFKIQGDFSASGYALLDLPLHKRKLVLDLGAYDFQVAPIFYQRGITSSPKDYLQPKVEGAYKLGQLTYTLFDRMLEAFYRYGTGNERLLRVLDKDGNEYQAIDTKKYNIRFDAFGLTADYTDDRLDPRHGVRFEVARKQNRSQNALTSKYYVMDYNLSAYYPVRKWDTLAFNFFASQAHVTRRGETDYATLQAQAGLGCAQLPAGPEQNQCRVTEDDRIRQLQAHNKYGTASSLGGTQRLRSFDGGRYYAGRTVFYGMEYRWNLTEERTPFDIYIARSVRTNLQLAVFAEQGSVADQYDDLWKHRRTSAGIGFRLLLSGIIIRADLSWGTEGNATVLFITYPWSMFTVDNPG